LAFGGRRADRRYRQLAPRLEANKECYHGTDAFDGDENRKRQRRKRQSVTAK